MNLPKQLIGRLFLITGFVGGALLGYLQMNNSVPGGLPYLSKEAILWIYSLVYLGFLASWFALFDYTKKLEKEQ